MESDHGTPRHLLIVGVMGSGTSSVPERARTVGTLLARRGVHLLTGGGGGTMQEVARAFVEIRPRAGLSLGILPCLREDPRRSPPGYPNPWVELPVRTHLWGRGTDGGEVFSRNAINVATSDLIVVLPGGAGTRSEAALALDYGRPVVAWVDDPATWPAGVEHVADAPGLEGWLDERLEALRAPDRGRPPRP